MLANIRMARHPTRALMGVSYFSDSIVIVVDLVAVRVSPLQKLDNSSSMVVENRHGIRKRDRKKVEGEWDGV